MSVNISYKYVHIITRVRPTEWNRERGRGDEGEMPSMKCCVVQTVVTDVEHLNIVHFDGAGTCVISRSWLPSDRLHEQQALISSPSWMPAAPGVPTRQAVFHRSVQTSGPPPTLWPNHCQAHSTQIFHQSCTSRCTLHAATRRRRSGRQTRCSLKISDRGCNEKMRRRRRCFANHLQSASNI